MIERPAIVDLFRTQHGCAHCHQLLEAGATWHSIGRARRKGSVVDLLPLVVQLAAVPASFETRAMAAQLQCRPDGFLSGFTAAAVRGMSGMPRSRIFVTIPRRMASVGRAACHQRTPLPLWIDRSESNWHDDDQVVMVEGFRVEEAYSMMFTLAAHMNDFRFERAAEDAWRRGIITPAGLAEYVDAYRRRGRSGVARCVRWLQRVGVRVRPTQSDFEVEMLQAIRLAHLPEPSKQHPLRLGSGEVIHLDLAWAARRLAIEPGHTLFHDGVLTTERDRRRDNACAELGWQVMRYSEAARGNLPNCAEEIRRAYLTRPEVA